MNTIELNARFSNPLVKWYLENKRDLPWRATTDSYKIWLSEIILQQTRVDQGLPYYINFVDRYPTIIDLAEATIDEVLNLWQGLGYYSRARNLHTTAKYVVEEYAGVFPQTYKEIIALKGIGKYTAAAIMSFAHNAPYAAVDGNVYRVLSRIYGLDSYIDVAEGKREFQSLASLLLDKNKPGLYNQAIMDFGAMQCVPKSPSCTACIFSASCIAHNTNRVHELPRKRGRVKVRARFFNYLDLRLDDRLVMRKREEKDIWQGLYEFPLIETEDEVEFEDLVKSNEYKELLNASRNIILISKRSVKHVLSHQIIYSTFYKMKLDNFVSTDYAQVDKNELLNYAVSRLIEKYLEDDL